MKIRKIFCCFLLATSLYGQCDGDDVKQAFLDAFMDKLIQEGGEEKDELVRLLFPKIFKISFSNTKKMGGSFPFGDTMECKSKVTITFDPSVIDGKGEKESMSIMAKYKVIKNGKKTSVELDDSFWKEVENLK